MLRRKTARIMHAHNNENVAALSWQQPTHFKWMPTRSRVFYRPTGIPRLAIAYRFNCARHLTPFFVATASGEAERAVLHSRTLQLHPSLSLSLCRQNVARLSQEHVLGARRGRRLAALPVSVLCLCPYCPPARPIDRESVDTAWVVA